ncbi:MAG: NAD-dependent epimerase/dehydratase family protein [Candidatus Zixiibacteriota bacterium]|nr:MAG: NAD-dependent epimerase/dehydratase family protein [candidate division Zixibacteria bacterium]
MDRVLVTGAGGYIGSVLVPKLLKAGYAVRAVDRFFFGKDKLAAQPNLEILVEDSRVIDGGFFKGIDFVIDLVAISNDPSAELFSDETWAINHAGRVNCAQLARESGVKRYILPSSASIYGYQDELVDENSPTNPLTVYARANERTEHEVLAKVGGDFVVTVLRQATVYGFSPRMRFDLAVNGMTYGCWKHGKLPLMRDGKQYRPMVHIQDATDVMLRLLTFDATVINGQVFNVGSEDGNFQIEDLARRVAETAGKKTRRTIEIEWYGDPDHRSYRLSFAKIERLLKWRAQSTVERGVEEIIDALDRGEVEKTPDTITLDWYQHLTHWHKIIKEVEKYGGILDIDRKPPV